MSDFIDDFLNNLDEDKSKGNEGFNDRIQKLYFSYEGNHGIMIFAPFVDKATQRIYISLPKVKEYKATCSKFKNGDEESWIKILPKSAYGELTADQSALYEEASSLWDQVNDEIGDNEGSFSQIREKTYSLMQGIVISQRDLNKSTVDDYVNKAALLIFPGKSAINALAAAVESKVASVGNKSWISAVFSPNAEGRKGAVVISFNKNLSTGVGYQSTVQFEMNSEWSKVVDSDKFEAAEVAKFGNMVTTFLGWQAGDNDHAFDSKVFEELIAALKLKLKGIDNPTPAPSQEAPENKNGVDPMLTPTPAPAPTTGPETQAAPGGVKYPF
jgi:hypothetical protein